MWYERYEVREIMSNIAYDVLCYISSWVNGIVKEEWGKLTGWTAWLSGKLKWSMKWVGISYYLNN